MRLRAVIIALGIVCAATSGAADLKDMFNRAKEKAVETLKKESSVPATPAVQPTQEAASGQSVGNAQPASAAESAVSQAPAASQQTSAAAGKQASPNADELWPNLAVDEAVVKQQQVLFGQRCKERFGNRPDIDCGCMSERYPHARLQVLTDALRQWDRRQRIACQSSPGSCDAPDRRAFLWLMEAKTQKNYPTLEGEPLPRPRGGRAGTDLETVFSYATTKLDVQCRNYDWMGADAEERCLQNVRSGSLKLRPGTSTKGYCACVRQSTAAQMSESEALSKCGQN